MSIVPSSNGHKGTALIYCRVSGKGQANDGTSLETQEEACRKKAQELDYAVAGVYREVYTGDEIIDRPQLNLLRHDVRQNRYAAVIIYKVDRITRAQGLTGYLLREFEKSG